MAELQSRPSEATPIEMQEHLLALETQYKGLQTLVGELLLTNQNLRLGLARLKRPDVPIAMATHPQPRQDH